MDARVLGRRLGGGDRGGVGEDDPMFVEGAGSAAPSEPGSLRRDGERRGSTSGELQECTDADADADADGNA